LRKSVATCNLPAALAKTDDIDARVLALYAERTQPPLRELSDEQSQTLRALWVRRVQLIEMLVMEENRLEHAPKRPRPCATTRARISISPQTDQAG